MQQLRILPLFITRRFIRIGAAGIAAAVACLSAAGPASAEFPKKQLLPLDTALKIAAAAQKKCQADGYAVSAVVVDRDGVVLAQLRNELAGPHTLNSSYRKAFTAASLGRSTQELANALQAKPELFGMRNMDDRILILGGGLPIRAENELLGGIGVGGAPGGNLDEACARAGLELLPPDEK